jgi:hypothetical protein
MYWTFQQLMTALLVPTALSGTNRPEQSQLGPNDACLSSAEPAWLNWRCGLKLTSFRMPSIVDHYVRTQLYSTEPKQPKRCE